MFHVCPAPTLALITEKPTHAETDDHLTAPGGQPGNVTPVPAVNACRGMLAQGTWPWRSAARRVDQHAVIHDRGLAHYDVQAREEYVFKRFPLHGEVIPWRNGPAIPPFEDL